MQDVILAVVRDPGGLNGILPVIRELRAISMHDIRLIANGTSARLLANTDENYEVLQTVDEAFRRYVPNNKPKAVITSMCSSGGINNGMISAFRGLCPTISFHDYWGISLLRQGWDNPKCHPDFMVVNDELDTDIVLRAWPDYERRQLITTGYPTSDEFAIPFDKTALKMELSSRLGVDLSVRPMVLAPIGILQNASKVLSEIVYALNQLALDAYFIPRFHPRMSKEAPEEVNLCRIVQGEFKGNVLIDDSSACSIQELLKASDLIISDYSTVLFHAVLLREPNISVWYLPEVQNEYHREFGPVTRFMPEPPFMTLGCTAKATDRTSLGQQISDTLDGKLDMRAKQEKHFPLDGQNAKRAAEFILSLI